VKPIRSLLVFSFVLSTSLNLFAAHSAIDPAPRTDQGWKNRQELLNKRAAEAGEKARVIFIGDSITQGWEGAGKLPWADNYAQYDAVNLGIGGDRTQHVLWRLDNGNLAGLNPKVAVVMIGTNNSNGEDNTAEQIAGGVRAIVEKLRGNLPEMKVLLVAIFPRGENPNPQRGKILQANQIIRRLADNQNVIWVDFGHKFVDDDGRIPRDLMPDYLHLSEQGYQIWVDSLRGPLNRALGQGQAQGRAGRNNLNGEWIATLPGPNNEPVPLPFTARVQGNRITGSFHAEGRDLEIENGRRNGDEFSWTVKRDRPDDGTMTYEMSGRIEHGAIVGKATTQLDGNNVTVDWSAKRK
jgi:lysophospholipase L1-like esterase